MTQTDFASQLWWARLTPSDSWDSVDDDHQTTSPSVSKMKEEGTSPGPGVPTPRVVRMNPFDAPVPEVVFLIISGMLGRASVANEKSALVQVFAPSVATMRNV